MKLKNEGPKSNFMFPPTSTVNIRISEETEAIFTHFVKEQICLQVHLATTELVIG